MFKRKVRAFTLIELMFVIGLAGIVFFIAIPNYNKFRRNQASAAAAMEFTSNIRREVQWARQTEGYSIVLLTGNSGMYNGYSIQRVSVSTSGNVFHPKKFYYMTNYMSTKIIYADAGEGPAVAWDERGTERPEFYVYPNEITFMGAGIMQDGANQAMYCPFNFSPGVEGQGYKVKVYVNCDVASPAFLGN